MISGPCWPTFASPARWSQDSDVVAFIYRDESYHPDSDQKGVAEIIVAKHRNGPTAKIRLAFLEHLTKFADLGQP